MAQHHDAPLGTRVTQGMSVAVAGTAVWFMADSHSVTGLSVRQVAFLLIAVALTGALAGAGYYATDGLRASVGWRGVLAKAGSLLAFCALALVLVLVLR